VSKQLFAAIEVPEAAAHHLAGSAPQSEGIRWLEQQHLTLGFFGDVEAAAEQKLREGLAAISFRAFFLPLVGVGSFSAKGKPSVIWIGVGQGHPHLFQLHKRVQEAAIRGGLEPDLRAFHPHVTVARCRDVTKQTIRPFLKSNADFDAGMFQVDEFHLFSSRPSVAGAVYTRELTLPSRQ